MSVSIAVTLIDRQGQSKQLENLRPVHMVGRKMAVTYKGRLYPLSPAGTIDLANDLPFPKNAKDRPATSKDLEALAKKKQKPENGSSKLRSAQSSAKAPIFSNNALSLIGSKLNGADRLQQSIIDAPPSARILVAAGPGTGKTQVAALRLSSLVKSKINPGQILVLSFSRSAVSTLTRRIADVAKEQPEVIEELRHVSIRTFDSWAFRILRMCGDNPHELLRRTHDENIQAAIELLEGPSREQVRSLLGKKRHLIVDEFQDLPGVRGQLVLTLLDLLAPPAQQDVGFTVLGDPAQAIYGFANREEVIDSNDVDHWQMLRGRYGHQLDQVRLIHNHRAAANISRFSEELRALIESNIPADEKLSCIREAIETISASEQRLGPEWRHTAGTTAVLTRTNAEAMRVVQKLFGSDVSGSSVSVSLRSGGRSSLAPAWLSALLSGAKTKAVGKSQFIRIYDLVAAELGAVKCANICMPEVEIAWARLTRAAGGNPDDSSLDIAALRARIDWTDTFPDDQDQEPHQHILVTTVHQSKGMEFDTVALLDGRSHRESIEEFSPGEEARVGFVSVTRAAKNLVRLIADEIHQPPVKRTFSDGGCRLYYSGRGWINLEIGLSGDVIPLSFVDHELHGSYEAVKSLQSFLLDQVGNLRGHKVMLVKKLAPSAINQVIYRMHLQEGSQPGRLLGSMSGELTRHLLDIVWKKGFRLPPTILNLRIAGVGTMTAREEAGGKLQSPYESSRLWLGVALFGTGDFQLRKREGKKSV